MAVTNSNKDLKKKISSAVCTLLGVASAAHASTFEGWEIDTATLIYSESDKRVQALEPTINLKRNFSEGRVANVKFLVDVLTGATPTGAVTTNVAQTFTRPSGSGSYVVQPGDVPLDDTFHDTRVALNGSYSKPLGRFSTLTFGGNASKEFDFLSLGGSAQITHDFNDRNTTLLFGLSTELDQITPEGGVPKPFQPMATAGAVQPRDGSSDNKNLVDVLLGVTQVLNAKTITQVNYSFSRASGYLNDPFKMLSRVDRNTGSTVDNVFEQRPDTRTKHAIYWLIKRHLGRDIVTGSYRYFFDDWGIKSHTIEANYHYKASEKWFLEPNVRFYQQTKADFYKVFLISGDATPKEASADYRLAKFNGYTGGLKLGRIFENESRLTFKFEYYTQVGDSHPSEAFGVLKGLDLYPDLKALMFQIQYSF